MQNSKSINLGFLGIGLRRTFSCAMWSSVGRKPKIMTVAPTWRGEYPADPSLMPASPREYDMNPTRAISDVIVSGFMSFVSQHLS